MFILYYKLSKHNKNSLEEYFVTILLFCQDFVYRENDFYSRSLKRYSFNLSNAIFKNENEFIILKWIYLKVLLYFGLIKKWNKLNENICWDITSWLMWISYNIIDILYTQFKEQIPVILNPWLTLIMCSWSAVKTTSRWADTSLGFMNINPNPKQC